MNTVANFPARLEALLGAEGVRISETELQGAAIGRQQPLAVAKPRTAPEVAEIVRFAAAEKLAVICCGSRSKLELGMPPSRYDLAIDLTRLREIVHYDPADLTLSVDAGLTLSELSTVLAEENQCLPLAVPFAGPATVGGTIASGVDSALRLQYGTARDFLIGAEFVDGTGRVCKSGGCVVKNVTGYDLHKLLIGSLGTLAAITRLNFRTFPLPELRGVFFATFPSLEAAFQFRSSAERSGLPLANLELFNPEFAQLLAARARDALPFRPGNHWTAYAAFEGNQPVLGRIQRDLETSAADCHADRCEIPDEKACAQWGRELRDTADWLPKAAPNLALLRIAGLSLTSADAAAVVNGSQAGLRHALLARPCNVTYLAVFCESEARADRIALESRVSECMSLAHAKKASVTLLHAPAWLKDDLSVWGPTGADFPLMQRVKHAFDPQAIFAPGRFAGGI
jgi:glycolate oxidase FAD binding subunit